MSFILCKLKSKFALNNPTMNYLDLLKKHESTFLKGNFEYVEFTPREFVLQQGNPPTYLYLSLEGKVKVIHTNSNGQSFLFGIFESPQLYGHLEIPNQDPFFNSVQCLSHCKFVKMRTEVYLAWLKKDPDFALKVNHDLCTKLMNSSYRMVETNYFSLEYHLLKYFVEATNNFKLSKIQINKTDLASYFGTNTRSINRLLKQLVSEDVIQIQKEDVEILESDEINKRIKKFF